MASQFDDAGRPRSSRSASGRRGSRRGSAEAGPATSLLPVLQKASDHPCFQCAQCCTYVAVEIDAPTTMKEYDHIVWYLYHDGITLFVDWSGDWFIKFESRCRHLTPAGLCGIYERRPAICKDFDWRECENNVRDEPADKWLFETAEDFLTWFRKQRPKSYERYQGFLRQKHRESADPELQRLAARPAARSERR